MIIAKSSGFGCCTFTDDCVHYSAQLAHLRVPLRLRTIRRTMPRSGVPCSVNTGVRLVLNPHNADPDNCYEIELGKTGVDRRHGSRHRFYRLLNGNRLLCTATVPARGVVEVSTNTTQYLLYESSSWTSVRILVRHGGAQAGAIYERGFSLGRRLFVDLDESIPLATQCFMVFLVGVHA